MAAKSDRISFQQVPKIKEVLDCFVPDPGFVFVSTDFESIEPKIQAVFSNDSLMRELYCSGKKHDIYLYNATLALPQYKDEIDQIYNLNNPTKESVEAAKQSFKKIRKAIKTLTLAKSYGAGANKIRQSLMIDGFTYTLAECKTMSDNYNNAYAGLKRWHEELSLEWEQHNGIIRNGLGRPLMIPKDFKKDFISRYSQSTAHDVLLTFIAILADKRQEARLERDWLPIILDFHDETIWQCREELVPQVTEIFKEAYKILNEELGWNVKITGEVVTGKTLADIKLA